MSSNPKVRHRAVPDTPERISHVLLQDGQVRVSCHGEFLVSTGAPINPVQVLLDQAVPDLECAVFAHFHKHPGVRRANFSPLV